MPAVHGLDLAPRWRWRHALRPQGSPSDTPTPRGPFTPLPAANACSSGSAKSAEASADLARETLG